MAKLETHHAPRSTTAAPAGGKEWSWSYSKLKNYDVCPKRNYEVDIARNFQDSGGEALTWGNEVHDAIAKALKSNAPLPPEMQSFDYWVDRVRRGSGELLVEQKYAITRNFEPTTYFAKDVWYRGVGDVVRIDTDVALVVDWKTGKVLEDSVQLMLMAQCLFSHYPTLKYVRSSFIWLKDDCETPELFTRQEVAQQWVELLPRVNAMEKAHKDMNFPPKPGRLCKRFCPVTSCAFHGKGA